MVDVHNQWSLSPEVIHAFTQGDCWRLAEELHRLTGYSLVAVGFEQEEEENLPLSQRCWMHVLNQCPDGTLLDVMGVHDSDSTLEYWAQEYGALINVNTADSQEWADLTQEAERSFPAFDVTHVAHRALSAYQASQEIAC